MMKPKQIGILSSVLTLIAIMSVTPAFGQSSMPGMSDQNMGTMTTMGQMSYDVTVGGKHFNMMISSTGKLPTNPQFNEEQKSVSFDVSGISSQDFVHYEIAMPTDLLSGNLTVNLGGIPVKAISEVNDSSTAIHITVPSSFVKSNNIPDSTTLTITGTQAPAPAATGQHCLDGGTLDCLRSGVRDARGERGPGSGRGRQGVATARIQAQAGPGQLAAAVAASAQRLRARLAAGFAARCRRLACQRHRRHRRGGSPATIAGSLVRGPVAGRSARGGGRRHPRQALHLAVPAAAREPPRRLDPFRRRLAPRWARCSTSARTRAS